MDRHDELMGRVRLEDRRAFEDLVQSSHRVVYGLALRVLGSSPEAEDVAQETYLRVWQARRQYDPRRHFDAWVARIAWNLCKSRLTKGKRQVSLLDQDVESGEPCPPIALARGDELRRVSDAVNRLPIEHRTALTLKYYAGLSYAEICQVMQVERPALTSLLYRARMMLRKLLEQDHER